MTWVPIEKPNKSKPVPRGVSIGVIEIGKYKHRMASVVWNDAPRWFSRDQPISICVGTGEHAGLLRISKGGPVVVRSKQAEGSNEAILGRVLVTAWDVVPGPHPLMLCQHETADDSVIITLPEWGARRIIRNTTVADLARQSTREPLPPVAPKPALTTPPAARAAADGLNNANAATVKASMATIQAWRADRGIVTSKLDLDRVNAKRRQLGQPPFEIETPARGGVRA